MLGNTYISNDQLMLQIPHSLDLCIDIDEFLLLFEAIGYQINQLVTIYIDAINESEYKSVWKSGLIPLLTKLEKYTHLRLAISVRRGYEKMVFNEAIFQRISNKSITQIIHTGFAKESIKAAKGFQNCYGIPFSPSYLFTAGNNQPIVSYVVLPGV